MRGTIYDEIGGAPAVTVVVDAFYERLLADPDLMSPRPVWWIWRAGTRRICQTGLLRPRKRSLA